MNRTATALALATTLCGAGPIAAGDLDAEAEAGRRLFTGLPATLDGRTLDAPRFACSGCHGRDGRGGREGDVPPVIWTSLSQPTRTRPAYDAQAFRRALTDGISPQGRPLTRLMPRMALSDDSLAALLAYLATDAADQTSGVSTDHIRFGVLATGLSASGAQRYARTVQQQLASRFSTGGVHGRSVSVEVIPTTMPPDAIAARVLAVLGARDSQSDTAAALLDRGVPVLFPVAPLTGAEDPALVRSFAATWRAILTTLAEEIAATPPHRLTILAQGDSDLRLAQGLAQRIALRNADLPVAIAAPDAPLSSDSGDVVLFGSRRAARGLGDGRLYVFTSRLNGALEGLAHHPAETTLVIEAPDLLERTLTSGQSAALEHARRAADILAAVLLEAGRGLTRAALLRAFTEAELSDLGLDYRRNPLGGTDGVRLLRLSGG